MLYQKAVTTTFDVCAPTRYAQCALQPPCFVYLYAQHIYIYMYMLSTVFVVYSLFVCYFYLFHVHLFFSYCNSYIVDQILSGQLRETIVESIHAKLMEVGQQVNNGQIPLELYYITKVRVVYNVS